MVRQLRPRCSILAVGGGTRTFVLGLLNSSGAPQRNYTAFHSRSRICFDELEDSLHHGTGVAKHYLHVSFIQYAHELSRSGVNHCEWRTSTSPSARPYCIPCPMHPVDADQQGSLDQRAMGGDHSILSEGSALSPGKRLHHQRSSRHAMVPLSDTSPHPEGRKASARR